MSCCALGSSAAHDADANLFTIGKNLREFNLAPLQRVQGRTGCSSSYFRTPQLGRIFLHVMRRRWQARSTSPRCGLDDNPRSRFLICAPTRRAKRRPETTSQLTPQGASDEHILPIKLCSKSDSAPRHSQPIEGEKICLGPTHAA